jgi:hypothetical protein
LPEKRECDIISPPGLKVGKNWQPFLRDGMLFAVHSFAPLTVLEISADGIARVAHEAPTQFWLPAPHDGFTMFRGGSNGIMSGDVLVGFGHLTATRDDHRPFVWAIDGLMQITLSIPGSFFGLRSKGFRIVDPTSLFPFNGRLHLGLCASEREWFYPQRFLDLLIELPCSDARSLCDGAIFVDLQHDALTRLPASRTFIPTDLPHQAPFREVNGGVESVGQAGHLLHGPYERIEDESSYLARLTYIACVPPGAKLAGRFEVSCYRDGEVELIAEMPLSETAGRIETATLPFSTVGRIGWLLETRVFVEADAKLNALSIRSLQTAADNNI